MEDRILSGQTIYIFFLEWRSIIFFLCMFKHLNILLKENYFTILFTTKKTKNSAISYQFFKLHGIKKSIKAIWWKY